MSDDDQNYPDNSAIHARKTQWRRERAARSFAQKLDALDELRARVEPIARARKARKTIRANPV